MAQKYVTKSTALKNTTGRTPSINYLSEKLTAVGILILLSLLLYACWPRPNPQSKTVQTYNKQLVNGDFSGASQTIEEAKNSGSDISFLSEGEAQRLKDVNDINKQYTE